MQRSIISILLSFTFLFLQSCEGDEMLATEVIGSSDSLLIKKIRLQYDDPTDPIDHTYIPRFDSATRSLTVYLDDPSTETILDKAFRKYEYNQSGYLTRMSVLDTNGVLTPQFLLQRNAINQ